MLCQSVGNRSAPAFFFVLRNNSRYILMGAEISREASSNASHERPNTKLLAFCADNRVRKLQVGRIDAVATSVTIASVDAPRSFRRHGQGEALGRH